MTYNRGYRDWKKFHGNPGRCRNPIPRLQLGRYVRFDCLAVAAWLTAPRPRRPVRQGRMFPSRHWNAAALPKQLPDRSRLLLSAPSMGIKPAALRHCNYCTYGHICERDRVEAGPATLLLFCTHELLLPQQLLLALREHLLTDIDDRHC